MLAKFKPLVVKLLDYYPVAATILFLVVLSVASLADSEGFIDISTLVFGIPAPAVAFAVSRGVKAELRKEDKEKTEHWQVKFVKYFFGTAAVLCIIYAIVVWFDPTEPAMFDKALLSLINGVYGPAMAFVVYKVARYALWVSGIDDK